MSALKNLLEGRPVKVPLHAAVVHFPLACFAIGTLLDCASWFLRDAELHLVPAGFWAIAAGIGTALLAAIFGFVEFSSIRRDHPGKKYAVAHMLLNLASVGLYALSLYLRREAFGDVRTPTGAFAASLVGFLLLMISGYIGGHLIYNDGIAVGRHRRETPLPDHTLETEGEQDEFAPVCHVDEFVDGGTLRANIRGTLITLAKSEGEFFAVQEFCTHRFGPLSEGAVENGQITCPWHRSCFDLRTGQVTEGPAKVPLKTFPVEVRANRIFVKVPVRPRSSAT
jgi:nitrite reductase/ring-hydroxylating ferredoxin subunit/uncharacterized membrane protein